MDLYQVLFPRLWIHQDTFDPKTVNLYIYTCGFKKRTGSCGGICTITCRTAFHLRRDVEDLPPVSCLHHQWEKRMIKKLNCMFGGLYRVLGERYMTICTGGIHDPLFVKDAPIKQGLSNSSSIGGNSQRISSSYLVVVYLWFLSPSLSSVLFHVLQYSAKTG